MHNWHLFSGDFNISVSGMGMPPWRRNIAMAPFQRRIQFFEDGHRKDHFFNCMATNVSIERFPNNISDNHIEIIENVEIFGYPEIGNMN